MMELDRTATTSPIGTIDSFPALMFLFHRLSRIRLPTIFVRSRNGQGSSAAAQDAAEYSWEDDFLGTGNNQGSGWSTYAEAAAGKTTRQAQTKQPYFFRGRACEPMLMNLKRKSTNEGATRQRMDDRPTENNSTIDSDL
eukprot:263167-Hanusia_phi.AAC.5